MNFKVRRADIAPVTGILSGVAFPKTLIATSMIMIETIDQKNLVLSATDLEISIKKRVPAEIKEQVSIALPAKKLNLMLHEIPYEKIDFTKVDDKNMLIESGNISFKLFGIFKEDFPPFPEYKEKTSFVIKQKVLKQMINKTIFAASRDSAGKYTLTGILMEVENDYIKFVATDSHKLASIIHRIKTNISGSYIIPSKSLTQLKEILIDDEDAQIKVIFPEKEGQIVFKTDESEIFIRLVVGKYPDYKRIIPLSFKFELELPRDVISNATHRISILSEKIKFPVLYEFEKGKCLIKSITPDYGEGKEEVDLKENTLSFKASFNASYLLEAFKQFSSENIKFTYIDDSSPAMFKDLQDDYFCIIMPIKLATIIGE